MTSAGQHRESEVVKETLARYQGDPPPGHSPADVQEAVRESQRESRVTPVLTPSDDRDRQDEVMTSPDLPKNDVADRTGPEPAAVDRYADPAPAIEPPETPEPEPGH